MTEKIGLSAEGLDLPTADEIRGILEAKLRAKAAEEELKRHAAEAEIRHQKMMFLSDKVTPDFIKNIMQRVRTAALSGEKKILLGTFPAEWCTDGGRRINQGEPDWPETLQGIAREFYDFFERELKPRGFRLEVAVISFPDGMLGDVGAYLVWS